MCTEEALTTNTINMVEGFENGGLEFAVKVHEFTEFPRLVTDLAVMEHYINAAADRTEDALRVFKQMSASGVEPNAYAYAVIIKALAAADLKRNPNFVTFAKMYFVEMLDNGMQPNEETYEAVLGGIGRGENKTKAEEERREFEENVKGKGFMLVLQKGAEEMAKPPSLKSEMDMHKEHVMRVFEGVIREFEDENERKRCRQIVEGNYDSLSTYAFTFYNCLLGKGLNEEAKELFEPLLEMAILPDEAVFTIVIHITKTKSDARKVYEYMLAYGITPSSCTYSVLITKLSLDPNFIGVAKKYYLEMLDNGMKPCLRTSLAVLSGIACLESLEDGEEFLEQVKPKGVLPDSGAGRLIELMKGYKLFGDLQKRTTDKEIQEVIREITVEGFQKHASKMFDAMVEDGNVGEAMDLFQSTGETRINPMVIVHTTVIEAHIKFNKNEDALRTYLDMLAAGFEPNSYMYNVLIKALAADANFFGDAKKYLIEMLDKGMHPNVATYTAVLEGFARQVDKKAEEEGKKFLEVMHPLISSFPNFRSQEKHYHKGSMFGSYSFINVIGGREEIDEDGSRKNIVEVAIISHILGYMYKKWTESKKKLMIGIVSPCAAQVVAIEEKLAPKYNDLDGFTVKVSTVDGFQGGEEDIIILSTVQSNYKQSLESVSEPRRFDVSLTRARHCLWILGTETNLCDNESVWKAVIPDAKNRQCFFSADEDKDLAKAILEVKKQYDQLEDMLSPDSLLFRSARWKVLFSDNFVKLFKKLNSVCLKMSVLSVVLKLASGWRPKKKNSERIFVSSSLILQIFKVKHLYVVCTTDIAEDLRYSQVLKIWSILSIEDVTTFVDRLDHIMNNYADDIFDLHIEKCLEGEMDFNWSSHLAKEEVSDREPIVVSEVKSSNNREGTTVIAIITRDAIFIASDTFLISSDPASLNHILEGKHKKIVLLNDRVVATLAGNEANCKALLNTLKGEVPADANVHLWRDACRRSIMQWELNQPFRATIGFHSWHDDGPLISFQGVTNEMKTNIGAILVCGSGREWATEYLGLQIWDRNWSSQDYCDLLRKALTVTSMHSPATGGKFPVFRLSRGGGIQVEDAGNHSLTCFSQYYQQVSDFRLPIRELNVDFRKKLILLTQNLPYTSENEKMVRAAVFAQLRDVLSAHVMGVAKKSRFDGCLSGCDAFGKVDVVVWIVDLISREAAERAAQIRLKIPSTKSRLFVPTQEKLRTVSSFFELDSNVVF